jgi:hypothetical protein
MSKAKRTDRLTAREKKIVSTAFDIGFKLGKGTYDFFNLKFLNIEGYYDFDVIWKECANSAMDAKDAK